MFACVRELLRTGEHERVVGQIDDALKSGHLGRIDLLGHIVANKQEFRLAVIDDVVYLLGLELILYGHCHCTIGEGGKERHCPVGGIAPAESDFVARFHSGMFEEDVELFDFARHVMIL